MEQEMVPRVAGTTDVDRATETITLAFRDDPVWSVALARGDGGMDHHGPYWRYFVAAAVEQGGVWLLGDAAAVAVWIPPGGVELPPEQLAAVEEYCRAQLGAEGAHQLDELFERFEANHPRTELHAYLSLLATHPDHRGRGIGQRLLAANLAHWDELGVPTYLESTNPGNDHRYERAGFQRVGGFTAVRDRAPITTMWRVVGGSG
jgi:GNAT superfamily N-acetyltransferase